MTTALTVLITKYLYANTSQDRHGCTCEHTERKHRPLCGERSECLLRRLGEYTFPLRDSCSTFSTNTLRSAQPSLHLVITDDVGVDVHQPHAGLFSTCTSSSTDAIKEARAFHFLLGLGSFSPSLLTHHISSHLLEVLPRHARHSLGDCLAPGSLWRSTLLHEPLHLRLKTSLQYTLRSRQCTLECSVLVGDLPNRSASDIGPCTKLHQRSVALSFGHRVQLGLDPSHKLRLQHGVGVPRSAKLRSRGWAWTLQQRLLIQRRSTKSFSPSHGAYFSRVRLLATKQRGKAPSGGLGRGYYLPLITNKECCFPSLRILGRLCWLDPLVIN